MKHSLYRKFLICYAVFGVLCFGIVAIFSSRLTYRATLSQTASRLYREAMKIASDYSDIYTGGQIPDDFGNRLKALQTYTGTRVWFISPDGAITFDSASEPSSLTGERIADFDPADTRSYYRTGSFYGTFPEEELSVQAPVTANLSTYGYIILHLPVTDLHSEADRLLIPIYITALLIYLCTLMILVLLRHTVIRPMKEITKGAGEFAAGNLKYRIDVRHQDEMGYLASTLNVMAEELSNSEDYQKKFISNVSHDFRSPLTSIKGYINAILDGVIPPENQEHYLRIVVNEADRLTSLTQSMLSLNSLSRGNLTLDLEDFDLCALIRAVCETFGGTCRTRGISFDLILSDAQVFVRADRGKIQRVIYNLVDNAIKFSDDHSVITISVTAGRAKAAISVKDTGCGIPKKDQSQIWTRFFKSDRSRGRDKQGTGLGLSIVKEIMTAHHETIDVISTEGVGTEFIFHLPLSQPEEEEP